MRSSAARCSAVARAWGGSGGVHVHTWAREPCHVGVRLREARSTGGLAAHGAGTGAPAVGPGAGTMLDAAGATAGARFGAGAGAGALSDAADADASAATVAVSSV